MDKIIDSFNIYTCSDRGEENPSSTGDVFELNMNNQKKNARRKKEAKGVTRHTTLLEPWNLINAEENWLIYIKKHS